MGSKREKGGVWQDFSKIQVLSQNRAPNRFEASKASHKAFKSHFSWSEHKNFDPWALKHEKHFFSKNHFFTSKTSKILDFPFGFPCICGKEGCTAPTFMNHTATAANANARRL